MAIYSKFLSLINGANRTVDLSTNTLSVQGLQVNGSVSGSVTQLAHASGTAYSISWPAAQAASSGYVLSNDGTGNLSWVSGSAGSVTSVALADGSTTPIYTITNSPVTSTGTLTFSLNTQAANIVFAGPSSGSAAQPSFRSLVVADLPSGIPYSKLTLTGSIVNADISSSAAIAYSKLNLSASVQATDLNSGSATSTQALFADGSGNAAYRSIASGDLPSLSATYVTNSRVGVAGSGTTGTTYGIAPLDTAGKIPVAFLPSAVFIYQGTWNPTTNTPTLVDGTGTTGYVYWVSAAFAGPVSGLNNASMYNFQIGDLVLYNGTQWELTTPAAGVQSVNGAQGAVTVNAINQLTGDVTAGPASGSASAAATLATVNSNVGSFGSSTSIPSFTVNAKGLITAASGNAVIAPAGTLSGTTLNSTVVTSSLTSVGTITTGVWNGTTIAIANGGTGQTTASTAFNALSPLTTLGDLLYGGSSGAGTRLGIGSTGNVLTVVGGIPAWAAPATSGTVTSVSLAAPSIFTVSGSPVTSSGTLTLTLASETANTVFAGPNGSSGTPTFRALVTADLSSGIVTASKLGTVTDGTTLDQSGAGSTLEIKANGVSATQLSTGAFDQNTITGGGGTAASVAFAPYANAVEASYVAGQTFSSTNTTYAVRWGIAANSETAGRIYACDTATGSYDLFYCIGTISVSGSAITAGSTVKVFERGVVTLGSSDPSMTLSGQPVYLASGGGLTQTSPTSSGTAVTRVGILISSTQVDVNPVPVGVN